MLNDYKCALEVQKEVLSSLPRNNSKNEKQYQEKIEELLTKYNEEESLVLSEIIKRRTRYLSLEYDEEIDTLTKQKELLYQKLPTLNKYNSSYEKSTLDIILYELGHFYKTDLEKVNKDIAKALKIFADVGVSLTEKDFIYSYYSNNYMKKFFLPNITIEELERDFEEIYWKCPDIITHITLNLKHLYYQNKKKFDQYYEKEIELLQEENIKEKYSSLYKEIEERTANSAYILQNNLLEDKLNINDYTKEKVIKSYSQLIDPPYTEKTNSNIKKLYYSVLEYKNYLELDYIAKDIKELYKDKEKYKNIYNNKKKEINKLEKKQFNNNKKLLKLLRKGKEIKINILNSKINKDINILTVLYEELEKNYFLEKISSLEENTSLFDIFLLASSNYNYLIELLKKKDLPENEIQKLNTFINNPYINILTNILITEEKDISMLIIDRYNLFGFTLTKEKLARENIDSLINNLEIILNSILMNKLSITESKIKFLKETKGLE